MWIWKTSRTSSGTLTRSRSHFMIRTRKRFRIATPNWASAASRRRSSRLSGISFIWIEVGERIRQGWELKLESVFQESARDAASSGQRQAGFCAHERRSDLGGPGRDGRAPGPVQRAPQLAHEFRVRHRVRTSSVEYAGKIGALDRVDEHADE